MASIATTMILRSARRATSSRAIASCRTCNQTNVSGASASAAASELSMGMHRHDVESIARYLESDFESDNTFGSTIDRLENQLPATEYDAGDLRSRLPSQLNVRGWGMLDKTSIERKLPPLDEDAVEEVIIECYAQPLPKSIHDISLSKLDDDARAIVVTDTKNPYRIVAVNTAWENLCGYKRGECQGHSLGRLLQGPETDMGTVTALLSKLLAGEEAGAVLKNYTKAGRKFTNNIRVGPVVDEMGKTVKFIGVLREVKDPKVKLSGYHHGERAQLPFMS
ncbi:hypothetical protein ACHAWF_004936 [Thalassiosira exigua]